jgi:hypothetical protein
MATDQENRARAERIEAKLDEASTEITTELQRLREAIANTPGPGSSPETDAIMARLEEKASALAEVGNAPE